MSKEVPLEVFGLLTDIQYADITDVTNRHGISRHYRNSLNQIEKAITSWKGYEKSTGTSLKFILQLGDLIDRKCVNNSYNSMCLVLGTLNLNYQKKILHVWGNHELYNFKQNELANTPLNTARLLDQPADKEDSNYYSYKVTDKLMISH